MPITPDVYKKIVGAKVYIDQNFREPINLDRLAREACLSRFHFHRLFTRIYQKTPHQYLTGKRIGQAPRRYRHLAKQKLQDAREEPRRCIPQCFIDTLALENTPGK